MVVVQARAGGRTGIGYTYSDAAAATLIAGTLAEAVRGEDALAPQAAWAKMASAVRNSRAFG